MRRATWLVGLLFIAAGCGRQSAEWSLVASAAAAEPGAATPAPSAQTLIVSGTSLPAPGRVSEIAATVMHPVTKVYVKPGDQVRVGDPLVELDADEPEADVRAHRAEVTELTAALARLRAMPRGEERAQAKAELESAQIHTRASQAYLERLTTLRSQEAISERQLIEQQTTTLRAIADQQAAQARLDYLLKQPIELEIAEAAASLKAAEAELEAVEAELEHYVVYASIDGIVCWLDVTPGTVSRAGTKVWGELVDLREVDVQVELTPKQLSQVDLSQPIEVRLGELGTVWPAQFVFAAPAANRTSGKIPVTLRVKNSGEPLRCHLPVTVEFRRLAENRPVERPSQASLAAQPAGGADGR
ncbi:MAG: efflux RND transporter periplasmic adaptor subunit [Planctomycetes bacterium]|nr:efflux RND transporter periplasmic adaptor subunit [Planctomycetota bacterium]